MKVVRFFCWWGRFCLLFGCCDSVFNLRPAWIKYLWEFHWFVVCYWPWWLLMNWPCLSCGWEGALEFPWSGYSSAYLHQDLFYSSTHQGDRQQSSIFLVTLSTDHSWDEKCDTLSLTGWHVVSMMNALSLISVCSCCLYRISYSQLSCCN